MTKLIKRIEAWFEAYGHFVVFHRWRILGIVLLLTTALLTQLPQLRMDTSNEVFFGKNDPALINYKIFQEQFGRDELIILGLQPRDIFDFSFLQKLKRLHEELENKVPHVDEVNSLINARWTRGKEGELIVKDLLKDLPQLESELQTLKQEVLTHPFYKNLLISENGQLTTVTVQLNRYTSEGIGLERLDGFSQTDTFERKSPTLSPLLTDTEKGEAVAAVRAIIARYQSPELTIYLTGHTVVSDILKQFLKRDMGMFTGLSIITISVILLVLFRRMTGVLFPLLIVILSLLATFSFMASLEIPLSPVTQIIPSLLLAVGIGDSVHILAIFYRRLDQGQSKEQAIASALGHSGLAVLMTSLTTAGGILSFISAEIAPVVHLGIFGAVGVMFALAYTLILLPALLALSPLHPRTIRSQKTEWWDRVLVRFGRLASHHPWSVIGVSTVLLAVAFIGIAQLRFSHNVLHWFPRDSPIREAGELFNREMRGTVSLEVVVDTGVENGLYEPDLMNKLSELGTAIQQSSYAEGGLPVGKTLSIVNILKETHQALNENRSEFYSVPQNRELIAQELFLFENSGSEDLEDVVDSQFSKARFSILVPWVQAQAYQSMIEEILPRFQETFKGSATVTLTGITSLFARTNTAVMTSMIKSYLIAGLVITLLMMVLLGSLKTGLLSMIPNVIPVLVALGTMGWLDVPLNVSTILIGSIAIGLAVDDTIHFMHNFRRYYHNTGNTVEAIHQTFITTGRAMLVTTVVLTLGFFTFMMSSMTNIFDFGLFTGTAIAIALLADLLLVPALLVVGANLQKSREIGVEQKKSLTLS